MTTSKKNSKVASVFSRNALVAAFLSVPVALILFLPLARLFGADDGTGLLDMTVIYPWFAFLAAVGSTVYTATLLVVHRRGIQLTRTRASLFVPLAMVPWIAFPVRGLFLYPPFVISFAAGLFVLILVGAIPGGRPTSLQDG